MLRSLFSGVSGMRSQQTKMDTIGNNVANVNTTAFKGARVTFKDALSQTQQGASSPTDNTGGVNPKMVGLGVSVAAIDTDMGQGYLQPTGGKTDLAIEGNGMFVVAKLKNNMIENPDGTNNIGNVTDMFFTRDGSFKLDKNGFLLTSEGYHVMGLRSDRIGITTEEPKKYYSNIEFDGGDPPKVKPGEIKYNDGGLDDKTINPAYMSNIVIPLEAKIGDETVKLTDFTIEQDGTIKALYGDSAIVLGQAALAVFQNPAGLEKKGGNLYIQSTNSGEAQFATANSPGCGKTVQGHLEMSNVDLANEFTEMIITSRAFQANSRTITTSDEMLQELLNLKR